MITLEQGTFLKLNRLGNVYKIQGRVQSASIVKSAIPGVSVTSIENLSLIP